MATIIPDGPGLGCRIEGLDLSKPLSGEFPSVCWGGNVLRLSMIEPVARWRSVVRSRWTNKDIPKSPSAIFLNRWNHL